MQPPGLTELEGSNSFPHPNVAQYVVCLTDDESMQLARVQPGICCNPQVFSSRAVPHAAASQPVPEQGLFPAHVQDLALSPSVPQGFLPAHRLLVSLWAEALLLFASATLPGHH